MKIKHFFSICMYVFFVLLFLSNGVYSQVSDEYDPPSFLHDGMQVIGTWQFKFLSGDLSVAPCYYWIDGKQTVESVSCWRMFNSEDGFFTTDNYGIEYVAIINNEYRLYMQERFVGDKYSKIIYSPYLIAWKYNVALGDQWSQNYTYTDTLTYSEIPTPHVTFGTVSEIYSILNYEDVTTDFGTYPNALKVEIQKTEQMDSNFTDMIEDAIGEYDMDFYDSLMDSYQDMIGTIEGMDSYTETTTYTIWNALGIGMVLLVPDEGYLESIHVTYEFISESGISNSGLTQTQVSQLYVSIFGRASEGNGNAYWCSEQDNMVQAASTMLATEAAQIYFGETLNDDLAFISFVYENTLGKTYEDDPAGINYWVSELTQGKSKGEVVAALINAMMDPQYTGNPAQNRFINMVAVCNYAADNIPSADVNDLTAFVEFIENVTDDSASVDATKALIDAF